jgi:alanyl-tRNA synthetase
VTSSEIRQKYLKFFEGHGHRVVPSSSLVPEDPSLLFTVAGMVPFKPMFLGQVRLEYTRAASCQKCIRTNDIDNVGRTRRHHTFFEMLGNFSFGDYFKAEAVPWAWEFLTDKNWMGLDKDKLWVSVYKDDEEAIALWKRLGVKDWKIKKMGEDSNFWTMGPTGPCGPCSEVYYDFGRGADPEVKEEDLENGGNRYVEIWNNVFTQFDRQADGSLNPLPQKNIDTGMGLERLAAVMQTGVGDNFETDLFQPLIQAVAEASGKPYGEQHPWNMSLRVIADHVRASAFLMADGVIPGNEGRGYVLRRIFRRAIRHGRLLGINELFLYKLVPKVAKMVEAAYPEMLKAEAKLELAFRSEEERFSKTLDSGLGILKELLPKIKSSGSGVLPGAQAFKLYDTYGFPLELTQELAAEQGLGVDKLEFDAEMEKQREQARAAWKGGGHGEDAVYGGLATRMARTAFLGYGAAEASAAVAALVKQGKEVEEAGAGEDVEVVLDQTPFYGESGGQVGDSGVLEAVGLEAEVLDTVKRAGGALFVHRCRVHSGSLKAGTRLTARVDATRRQAIARHHSATHLLHAALRQVLGPQATQSGSYVGPERLRFDFAHGQALSPGQMESVERLANQYALRDAMGDIREMTSKEAQAEGATALFDEKYGEKVRVVSFGNFSKELCGGTHVRATGELGLIKILSESSVSAGIRRLEAVAGEAAYEEVRRGESMLSGLSQRLKTSVAELPARLEKVLEREKELLRQIEKLKTQGGAGTIDGYLSAAQDVLGVRLVAAVLPDTDADTLKGLGDQLKERLKSGVVLLGSSQEDKATLIAMVTKDLVAKVSAGKLVAELAPLVGGRGGGKPEMAQAGGKEVSRLPEAVEAAKMALEKQLQAG